MPSTEHAPEPSQNGSQASSSNSSSQKSKIWSSYADNYFEEDFKPGFYSDSEEEQEEESAEEPAPPTTVQTSPLTPAGVATAGPAPADALEPSGSRLSGDSSSLDSSPTRSLEHSERCIHCIIIQYIHTSAGLQCTCLLPFVIFLSCTSG